MFYTGNRIVTSEETQIVKEGQIDFIYAYGDEDSAIFRIAISKLDEKTQIEEIKCPLQAELFKDNRWRYGRGNISKEESDKLFRKISKDKISALQNSYSWKGTTAHHPALLQIYYRFDDNKEFKKEIQLNDYPQGIEDVPVRLKEVVEITRLLQDQANFISEELHGKRGEKELIRNLSEANTMVSGDLKYFSAQAVKVSQEK